MRPAVDPPQRARHTVPGTDVIWLMHGGFDPGLLTLSLLDGQVGPHVGFVQQIPPFPTPFTVRHAQS